MNPNNTQNNILEEIVPRSSGLGSGIAGILNQLFYAGLVVAVALALALVIRGAIQYMTTDGGDAKGSAKKRIQAALGGLVLAFSAILILNTVNPSLTAVRIRLDPLKLTNGTGIGLEGEEIGVESESGNQSGTNPSNTPYGSMASSTLAGLPPSQRSQALLKAAQDSVGAFSTCNAQTDYGNKGCAYGASKVISDLYGVDLNTLSTSEMKTKLVESGLFEIVATNNVGESLPGDVIIMPSRDYKDPQLGTPPGATTSGHVWFAETAGGVNLIGNSSTDATMARREGAGIVDSNANNRNLNYYVLRAR